MNSEAHTGQRGGADSFSGAEDEGITTVQAAYRRRGG